MKLSDLKQLENCQCIYDDDQERVIHDVYIGDLLSFVMAQGIEESLWLTVQRHINVMAVASLNDFIGIVFVEGVYPDEDVIDKAKELNIPLFTTSLTAFNFSKSLIERGL